MQLPNDPRVAVIGGGPVGSTSGRPKAQTWRALWTNCPQNIR